MKVVHTSDLRIATLSGHVALIEANVPVDLPDFLGLLALGKGAKQVLDDGEIEVDFLDGLDSGVHAPLETRHQRLVAVMQGLITAGDTANFRQDGQPKASVLNRLFGEPVLDEERTPAWDEATRKL